MDDKEGFGAVSEHFFQEKMNHLKQQLKQLDDYVHPEYLMGLDALSKQLNERLEHEELIKQLELERINREYDAEKLGVQKDLDLKKAELLETLTSELEEKRKQIEHEYHSMDLAGTSHSFYPANKKSLRRRPNEPAPLGEKRQRKASPQQITYQLSEEIIDDDLRTITSAVITQTTSSSTANDISPSPPPFGHVSASVDGSKLCYDGKWYLRGQTVYIESAEIGRVPAVIQTITSNIVHLKSVGDNKRMSIALNELQHGRVALRKRV